MVRVVSGYVQNMGVEVHVQGLVLVHIHIMRVSGYVQVWGVLHDHRLWGTWYWPGEGVSCTKGVRRC